MKKTVKRALTYLLVSIFSVSISGSYSVTANAGSEINNNKKLIEDRDKAIANSFEIDLTGYKVLNPPDKEYFKKNLLQARKQANIQPGDTVPITYISENELRAYILKQDAYGMNFMFEFDNSDGDWILISSEKNQGTIMPPVDQEESLKLRNSPEREVEIAIVSIP